MNVLILEDNLERIKKFKELFKNHELFLFDNVIDALISCYYNSFSIMMLDHDLDNRSWVDSEEPNTGYTFCKSLIGSETQKQAIIYIHSLNPIGANRMLNLLKDNDYDVQWIPYHLIGKYNG